MIIASDGLFDNLFDEEIAEIVNALVRVRKSVPHTPCLADPLLLCTLLQCRSRLLEGQGSSPGLSVTTSC